MHRLREAMVDLAARSHGRRRQRSSGRRNLLRQHVEARQGLQARATAQKASIVALVDPQGPSPRLPCARRRERCKRCAKSSLRNVHRKSTLVLTKAASTPSVGKEFAAHQTREHAQLARRVRQRRRLHHQQRSKTFSASSSAVCAGTYRSCGEQHLQRYLNGVCSSATTIVPASALPMGNGRRSR